MMQSAPHPDAVPWVVFHRKNRSRSVVVTAVTVPTAKDRGAQKLGVNVGDVDYAPVYQGESAETAKARVAGSSG